MPATALAVGCATEELHETESPLDTPALRAMLDDRPLAETIGRALGHEEPGIDAGAEPDAPIPPRIDARPPVGGSGGGTGTGGRAGSGGRGGSSGCFPGGTVDAGVRDAGMRPRTDGGVGQDGGGPVQCRPSPIGRWELDDCNASRSDLRDSSFSNFTAYRSVGTQCVPGVEGQGATFPRPQDLIYAPDQPAYTFEEGVTVAAWVKPDRAKGIQTIFRKREGKTSSFALLLVDKRFVFVIDRQGKFPAAVAAPARPGRFTHVAGTYDGESLRLYLDGEEAAAVPASGSIAPGEGPVLMGNDGSHRRFEGVVDKLWLDVRAASADVIRGLTCVRQPPKLTASPAASAPVAPGTPVIYTLTATNMNSASCEAASFFVQQERFVEGFSVSPSFSFVSMPSGESRTVPVTVSSSEEADPGEASFLFRVRSSDRFDQSGEATFSYVVSAEGCRVASRRELMIRDLSVVEDPIRTTFTGDAGDRRRGVWTFAQMMRSIAPRPEDAPDMAEEVFRTFTTRQTVNGFTVEPRSGMNPRVLEPWPRTADGKLDLERAPLRLLAIVNRMDMRNLARGNAGEGRFVFGVHDAEGQPLEFNVIFEFKLPASTEADVLSWARAWHALGSLPFPSEEYNAALERLTARFAGRGVMPGRPNGSALETFRTNEIALDFPWELREFVLSPAGRLVPSPVKLTPDLGLNGSAALGRWVNANEAAVLGETHELPDLFEGAGFAAGAIFNNFTRWDAEGITNPEARFRFALNTCNGCHSNETNTTFTQISNRLSGQESSLSPFLTGTTVFDGMGETPRTLNDLARRNRDLRTLVCPPGSVPPPPPSPPVPPTPPRRRDGGASVSVDAGAPMPPPVDETSSGPTPTVTKGIDRVH